MTTKHLHFAKERVRTYMATNDKGQFITQKRTCQIRLSMVLSFSIFKYELVTKTKLPSILSWKNCFTNRFLMFLCIPSNSLKPELAAFVNNPSRHLLTHPLLKHRLRTKQKATHLYFEHHTAKCFSLIFFGVL